LAIAYRGFSESEGSPNEIGLKLDADAIVEFLRKPNQGVENIMNTDLLFLHGRSLGGAVAIHTAHKYPELFKGLVIENTFSSISDMADVLFPFMGYLGNIKTMMIKNPWSSKRLVPEIELPILYITGDQDEIVPFEQTELLYRRSKKSVKSDLMVVKGGTHMTTWRKGGGDYLSKVFYFIKDCIHISKTTPS